MSDSRIIKEDVHKDAADLERLREKMRARMSEAEIMGKVADTRAVSQLSQGLMDNITMINQDVNQIYREEKEQRRQSLRFKKLFFPIGFDEIDRKSSEEARKEANKYARDRLMQTMGAGSQVAKLMSSLLGRIRGEKVTIEEDMLLEMDD